mgnify:CR=1 FL=1
MKLNIFSRMTTEQTYIQYIITITVHESIEIFKNKNNYVMNSMYPALVSQGPCGIREEESNRSRVDRIQNTTFL